MKKAILIFLKTLVELYKANSKNKIYVYVEETDNINDVLKKYNMTEDTKDFKRKYSKNATQ